VDEAVKHGLVQASGMRLTIHSTVEDYRRDGSAPLPIVASHEIVIP
jgi:hypothetical protein